MLPNIIILIICSKSHFCVTHWHNHGVKQYGLSFKFQLVERYDSCEISANLISNYVLHDFELLIYRGIFETTFKSQLHQCQGFTASLLKCTNVTIQSLIT